VSPAPQPGRVARSARNLTKPRVLLPIARSNRPDPKGGLLMRIFASWVFVVFQVSSAQAQTADSGSSVHTRVALRLRAAAAETATVLRVLPEGSDVVVQSCSSAWCAVSFRGQIGYAAARYLAPANTSASTASGVGISNRGYTNSKGIWVPSPVHTADGQPPPGASAQCNDGSYSFSMSRRGTCSHHGGVSRWL
jgi:uncharacterized protein YraI